MDKSFHLLQELLPLMDRFLKEGQEASACRFMQWASHQEDQREEWTKEAQEQAGIKAAQYLTYIFRFSRFYLKKGLHDSSITTPEEWTFLIHFFPDEHWSKSDLIHQNIIDFSSGSEIIKRLVKRGILKEYPDPDDKRVKRLHLSEEGKQAMAETMQTMSHIPNLLLGNLQQTEAEQLIYILEKLDQHHRDLYPTRRKQELYEMNISTD